MTMVVRNIEAVAVVKVSKILSGNMNYCNGAVSTGFSVRLLYYSHSIVAGGFELIS